MADRSSPQPQAPTPRTEPLPPAGQAAPAYAPLYNPATDESSYTPPVSTALTVARAFLDEAATTNIHDHAAILKTAAGLEYRLRQLVAALDAERAPAVAA